MEEPRWPGRNPLVRPAGEHIKLLLGSLALVAACAAIRYYWGAAPASADPMEQRLGQGRHNGRLFGESAHPGGTRTVGGGPYPTRPAAVANAAEQTAAGQCAAAGDRSAGATAAETPIPPVVAAVNNQRITREDLAQECLRHYGNEVLESMVNKQLIAGECRRQGITVTSAEVDAEIERMSKRFNIPVDQWLKMLKQERNVTPAQYANDIIWPTLALRKLAGDRLTISREDLIREFETQYGPMVRVRLIAVRRPGEGEEVAGPGGRPRRRPDYFGNLAKELFGGRRQRQPERGDQSDPHARELQGDRGRRVQHGRRRGLAGDLRRRAVRDPEAGRAYPGPARHVRADGPAARGNPPRPEDARGGQGDLRAAAKGRPKARSNRCGTIRRSGGRCPAWPPSSLGSPITIRELAEECIARHGQPILGRADQPPDSRTGVPAAERHGERGGHRRGNRRRGRRGGSSPSPTAPPTCKAGSNWSPRSKHISLDIYRHDVVWPIAALKKLVQGQSR